MHVSKISRRELFAGAGALLAGCVCSRTSAAAGRLRGPFPILTTPYDEDGRVDYESLAREAVFAADSGCPGVISERCAYAPLLMFIWNRMENGDKDGRLTEAFALFRLLIDQRGFPREDMRGYALYYFKRLGLFRTTLTRQYKNAKSEAQGTVSVGPDAHEWKLEDLNLSSSLRAELDRCYDDMLRFLRR